MKLVVFAAMLVCAAATQSEKARFDNYRVYSVNIENDEQLEILQELENHQDSLSFLKAPISTQRNAEIIVPPQKLADVMKFFEANQLNSSIKYENLQTYSFETKNTVLNRN